MPATKAAVRHFVIHSGLYKPVMFLRRNLLRRNELHRRHQATTFFKQHLNPGDLVFDIGANIGNMAEVFLRCGANVVSVEPQPECIAELTARFRRNPRFTLVPKAIGATLGTATMYLSKQNFMSSFDKNWLTEWAGTVEVPITTLDALIAQFGVPKFLKIDVEGWEIQVLAGLSQPVPLLCFEYHSGEKGLAQVSACLDRLEQIAPLQLNLSGQEHWELSLPQWLNRPQLLAELQRRMYAHPDSYGDIMVVQAKCVCPALR